LFERRSDLSAEWAIFAGGFPLVSRDAQRPGAGELGPALDVAQPGAAGLLRRDAAPGVVPRRQPPALHSDLDGYLRDLGGDLLGPAAQAGAGHVCGATDRSCLGLRDDWDLPAVSGGMDLG